MSWSRRGIVVRERHGFGEALALDGHDALGERLPGQSVLVDVAHQVTARVALPARRDHGLAGSRVRAAVSVMDGRARAALQRALLPLASCGVRRKIEALSPWGADPHGGADDACAAGGRRL